MGGDFDNETVARALAATIDEVYQKTGKDSILVTHSQGGGPGWTAAMYTEHIAAIIAIEPGGAPGADTEAYKAVTEKKIPVTFYFGDYIDNGDPSIQATGMWQMMRGTCYAFAESYTAQGGNCTVVDLPKEGITGNDHFMQILVDIVQKEVDGDVFQIITEEPYPSDYEATVDLATEQRESGFKPELKSKVENMDSYNTVYLGYPIWGGNIPAPIASFLSEYDFSGKTIVPFSAHE